METVQMDATPREGTRSTTEFCAISPLHAVPEESIMRTRRSVCREATFFLLGVVCGERVFYDSDDLFLYPGHPTASHFRQPVDELIAFAYSGNLLHTPQERQKPHRSPSPQP